MTLCRVSIEIGVVESPPRGLAERGHAGLMTLQSDPSSIEALDRAVAKLRSYDVLIHQVTDDREKAELQRWRTKAATAVLRTAITATDGSVPNEIADPLRRIEAACERGSSLPRWIDSDSFAGNALLVGVTVLVAGVAAPVGAAVVGDAMLRETIKTVVSTAVASMLTQAGDHVLGAKREQYLSSSRSGAADRPADLERQSRPTGSDAGRKRVVPAPAERGGPSSEGERSWSAPDQPRIARTDDEGHEVRPPAPRFPSGSASEVSRDERCRRDDRGR
jgi:hypothetical protein